MGLIVVILSITRLFSTEQMTKHDVSLNNKVLGRNREKMIFQT